jgi:hypothetical protein
LSVVRPAATGVARSSELIWSHLLCGCDPTQGIVSVAATSSGQARVWQRIGDRIDVTQERFPNWFLATSLDLLDHLPIQLASPALLRAAHGRLDRLPEPRGVTVVELDSVETTAADQDAYRYLVLTDRLDEVETLLVEMANKLDGAEATCLADLRGLVLIWPPVDQYLMLSGRTYFKGMAYADQRRLQFDLETTGLDEERDRIFMISLGDSTGWRACLDTSTQSEERLIARFVEIVRERDPDALENHNIFAFDLPFLVKRAARLGVPLALGRDASEPTIEIDSFENGERAEPFVRWRVAGREVIDTQQAVRRFAFSAPDMRRHGLKEAARYFGFARSNREYVPGVEVWPTFRVDPQRVRRYAADDVDEVDGLSRRLMPEVFGLAAMLPCSYERLAANLGPAALWEPLLVRAYLQEGRAIVAPSSKRQPDSASARAVLFVSGVVGAAAKASLPLLVPRLMANHNVTAPNDHLLVLPGLIERLFDAGDSPATTRLVATGHAYLSGADLFSDPEAAAMVLQVSRKSIDRVLEDLRVLGCLIVEVAGEQVLFGTPPTWTTALADEVARSSTRYLPSGVRLVFDGQYEALYARAPGSVILLSGDDSVTLVGATFRGGRLERFGEAFFHRAAPLALRGDAIGLRQAFLDTIYQLRTGQIALDDLCVLVTLHKSLPQYRRAGAREEPYEVLLQAGVRSWRIGQRIRYFRARGGEPRLHQEGDGLTADDVDTEYYVQRLASTYAGQFAQGYRREDFQRIFRVSAGRGPYSDEEVAELANVRPIRRHETPACPV